MRSVTTPLGWMDHVVPESVERWIWPAWPMRQIVLPLGAGTLRGVRVLSVLTMRPLTDAVDGVTCAPPREPESATATSLTMPGLTFERAGGGVAGMLEGELEVDCRTALASASAFSTGDAGAGFRGLAAAA